MSASGCESECALHRVVRRPAVNEDQPHGDMTPAQTHCAEKVVQLRGGLMCHTDDP